LATPVKKIMLNTDIDRKRFLIRVRFPQEH